MINFGDFNSVSCSVVLDPVGFELKVFSSLETRWNQFCMFPYCVAAYLSAVGTDHLAERSSYSSKRMEKSADSEFPYMPEDIDDKALRGARMVQIAKIALSDHNAKENTNLEFVEIDKADCDSYLAAGNLYHLTINVEDRDSPRRELKMIEKMVWKGSAMQVGDIVEVTDKPAKTPRSISRARIKKLVHLALDVHNATLPKEKKLRRTGIVVEEEKLEEFPKGKEGYIEFRIYNLYFTQDQRIFQISILHKKWFDMLDDCFVAHFCGKTYRPVLIDKPIHYQPSDKEKKDVSEPITGCCKLKLHPMDLDTPFILSFAWYAIEEYNFKQCKQLEFMEVLRAEGTSCAVLQFELTIKVKDKGVVKVFNTKLWSRFWVKQVEIESPLEESTPIETSEVLSIRQLDRWSVHRKASDESLTWSSVYLVD